MTWMRDENTHCGVSTVQEISIDGILYKAKISGRTITVDGDSSAISGLLSLLRSGRPFPLSISDWACAAVCVSAPGLHGIGRITSVTFAYSSVPK